MTTSMKRSWTTNCIALGVIVFMQAISVVIGYFVIAIFFGEELKVYAWVCQLIVCLIITFCLVGDSIFVYHRIWLFSRLANVRPIRCALEDIFFATYTDEGTTKYEPYLIIRSLENQKLYMTYGKGDMAGFNATFSYAGNQLLNYQIKKQNGKILQIGDYVDLYVLKPVKMKVDVNGDRVRLNGKKYKFTHITETIPVDVFYEVNFVQGVIDIDWEIN